MTEYEFQDKTYHPVTEDDLTNVEFRGRLERTFEDTLVGYIEDGRLLRGYTWDDILDKVDSNSFQMPDGRWVNLDFGNEYDSPIWRKIKKIAQKVGREMG